MSQQLRIACMDIGSNSIRLMVADVTDELIVTPLFKEVHSTRLAHGLVHTHLLSEESMNTAIEAVEKCMEKAAAYNARPLFAFATAAVRTADNGDTFVKLLHSHTGVLADVLSQQREAELGFLSIPGSGQRGMIDLGGGSLEIALGQDDSPELYTSLGIGAVTATDSFPIVDTADELTLMAMSQWARNIITSNAPQLIERSRQMESIRWTGIGGTLTTLAAMDMGMATYDPARVQGHILSLETVTGFKTMLSQLPLERRRQIPGLQPERADIIVGGITIVEAFMQAFGLSELGVSDTDNLEAYVISRLKKDGYFT